MVLLSTYGESGLIRAVDLRNFGINNPIVKDYARSTTLYEDLGLFTIGKSKDRTYLRPDAKSALGKNINDITKAKLKKYNEVGKANFDAMIDMIQKAIKEKEVSKQANRYLIRKRAKAVGLELLPPGRKTRSERDEWMKELERLENEQK